MIAWMLVCLGFIQTGSVSSLFSTPHECKVQPAPRPKLPPDLDKLYDAAKQKIDAGEFVEALALMKKLTLAEPRNVLVQYYTAEVAFLAERYLVAIQYCDAVLKLDAKYSDALALRAASHFHLKQYDKAESTLTSIIEIDATNHEALYNRAVCRRQLGKHTQALEDIKLVRKHRTDMKALHLSALILCDNGCLESALTENAIVIQNEPKFADGHLLRGTLLVGLERSKEAEEAFSRAVKLDPSVTDLVATLRKEGRALKERQEYFRSEKK